MRDEFILRAANTHVFDIHQMNAADAKFRTVTDQSPVKRAHRRTCEACVAQASGPFDLHQRGQEDSLHNAGGMRSKRRSYVRALVKSEIFMSSAVISPRASNNSANPATAAATARAVVLPDPSRYFEVRFESIGGLGAHAAGQVLATAAVVRMGLNGAHFSSYGSEKKGSLVRSFVRLAPGERPIRTSAPVETPDAVVVFHAALLRNPGTLAGLRKTGTLIYNAAAGILPEQLAALPKTARVIRVDALGIALREQSRANAVLLGTLCAGPGGECQRPLMAFPQPIIFRRLIAELHDSPIP